MALRSYELNNDVIITKAKTGKVVSVGSIRDWDPNEISQHSSLEDELLAIQENIDSAIAEELRRK